jgi:osmoprotectant transport system substrate-binding protein
LAAIALALALAAAVSACGGSGATDGSGSATTDSAANRTPTITVGARDTPMELILGQIYAQALRHAGFDVKVFELIAEQESAPKALELGFVSGYPEFISTPESLQWALPSETPPANAQAAYRQTRARLEKEGLTAFPPAPFSFTNLVVARRADATAHGWKTISDLESSSKPLTFAGIMGCHEAINCMVGMEQLYPLVPNAGIITGLSTIKEVYRELENGKADLAFIPSSEGRLVAERDRFAALAEDQHRFPAGNPIFITSRKLAAEAGPEFEATIVAAQRGLTLPVIQRLDAAVEFEKKDPAKVAAGYLSQLATGS